MQARILETIPSPMQSGPGIKKWIISFVPDRKTIDNVMGWSSSDYTMPQVKILFDTQSDAENFALSNGWEIEDIAQTYKRKTVKKAYADNFTD